MIFPLDPLIPPRDITPKEAPNTHCKMLHWGLLPRLTTEVVPQGLDAINTSHNEVNTSPMGFNTSTLLSP